MRIMAFADTELRIPFKSPKTAPTAVWSWVRALWTVLWSWLTSWEALGVPSKRLWMDWNSLLTIVLRLAMILLTELRRFWRSACYKFHIFMSLIIFKIHIKQFSLNMQISHREKVTISVVSVYTGNRVHASNRVPCTRFKIDVFLKFQSVTRIIEVK